MGIFRRDGVYYARVKYRGKWIRKTLNTKDRVVALAKRWRRAA